MSKQIEINVYAQGRTWYAAYWADGEYDGCDALDAETEDEAIAEARTMPLSYDGERIVKVVAAP